MSNQIYSPFSGNPVTSIPNGAMAGLYDADREFMMRQAQMQGLESMFTGNQQAAANLQRYQAQTPNEIIKSNLEGRTAQGQMDDPNYLRMMREGAIGTARSQASKGRVDVATEGGRIGEANSGHALNQLSTNLQRVRAIGASSPMMGQAAYQEMLKTIDPGLRAILPPMYTPQAITEATDAIGKILADTPAQRNEMAKVKAQGDNSLAVAREGASATRYAADRGAESREYVAGLRADAMNANTKQNFQQHLTAYANKRATGKNTPEDDRMAAMIEQMMARTAQNAGIDPIKYKEWVLGGMQPGQQPNPRGADMPEIPSAIPGNVKPANQQQAISAFGSYDPQTYDYVVDANGRVGRRKKQGK